MEALVTQQQLAWWGVRLLIRSFVLFPSWCGRSLTSYALLRSSVDIRLLLLCPASSTAGAVQAHHIHASGPYQPSPFVTTTTAAFTLQQKRSQCMVLCI